jgi:hypothetical protein
VDQSTSGLRQRVNYYGGQNSYFFLLSEDTAFKIVPTGVRASCFQTASTESVQLDVVFPDLSTVFEKYGPGAVVKNSGIPLGAKASKKKRKFEQDDDAGTKGKEVKGKDEVVDEDIQLLQEATKEMKKKTAVKKFLIAQKILAGEYVVPDEMEKKALQYVERLAPDFARARRLSHR